MSGGISFVIHCESQEEIDHYWEKLSEGGEAGQCGWINHDKFGVTWQVVPTILPKYLGNKDQKKAQAVMQAMLKMTKMDMAKLQAAYDSN
jgi:predicted 3-demethylubiquinone-9 3-methyltransferase (glyoxalase superfamily)